VLKCISILVSLQVVPLTIGYVNPTKYGIWLTLSSIIALLSACRNSSKNKKRAEIPKTVSSMYWGESNAMKQLRSVVGLGGQFFVVMFSMLFIFQLTNIILSRVQGPEAVTKSERHATKGLQSCIF
jgi:hypothetical protein